MRVLLQKDVKKIGRAGEVAEVTDGYARNYLIKNGLAVFADARVIAHLRQAAAAGEQKTRKDKQVAEDMARGLAAKPFIISRPATPGGTLYAGLKDSEILRMMKQSLPRLPEQAKINSYQPIKQVGEHKVHLDFGHGVLAKVILNVKRKE